MKRYASARLIIGVTLVAALAACGRGAPDSSDRPSAGGGGQAGVEGTLSATLNGEQRTWYITSATVDGRVVSQSDWESAGADGAIVTLFGHASATTFTSSREALMLEFTIWNLQDAPSAAGSDITFLSEGLSRNHNSGAGGASSVELTSVEVNGNRLNVTGSFQGELVFQDWTGGTSTAAGGPAPVSLENGRFEASILNSPDQT